METQDPIRYKVFRFLDYKVYQESKKWLQEISALSGVIENKKLFNKLESLALDVPLLIVSASTKLPDEAKDYLQRAVTSCNKLVACIDIATDYQLTAPEEFEMFQSGYKGITIQLKAFIKAINPKNSK